MSRFQHIIATVLQEAADTLHAVDETRLVELRQALTDAPRIFVAGRGRSGLQMRAFAMRLMHLGLPVHIVDEVTTPAIESGDLLLIGSGSGQTESLVRFAQTASKIGADVALITATASSPIAAVADIIVRLPAPTPKASESDLSTSIQPMGSRFEASVGILSDALILLLMDDFETSAEQMFARHANLE
jgi:6-phospho-3-hexuloisomerase